MKDVFNTQEIRWFAAEARHPSGEMDWPTAMLRVVDSHEALRKALCEADDARVKAVAAREDALMTARHATAAAEALARRMAEWRRLVGHVVGGATVGAALGLLLAWVL